MCYCCVLICNQLLAFKEWESAFMSEWEQSSCQNRNFSVKSDILSEYHGSIKGEYLLLGG